jgi:hypothetical protein
MKEIPVAPGAANFDGVESIKRAYAAKDAPPSDPLYPLPQVLQGIYTSLAILKNIDSRPTFVCVVFKCKSSRFRANGWFRLGFRVYGKPGTPWENKFFSMLMKRFCC